MKSVTFTLALLQVLNLPAQADQRSELSTECFESSACDGFLESEALSLLQMRSQEQQTDAEAAECSVGGEPHITSFDRRVHSLLDVDGAGHGIIDLFGPGVYWLMKSDLISLQA
eukprot:4227378-Amphidinium_carterae.1